MKKYRNLLLIVVLSCIFTACEEAGTIENAASDEIADTSVILEEAQQENTLSTEEYVFDLSWCDDEKYVQSLNDERYMDVYSVEGSGKITLGTEVDQPIGDGNVCQVMYYKELDFENLQIVRVTDGAQPFEQNAVRWFDYNDKRYVLTWEEDSRLVLVDGANRTVLSESWNTLEIVTTLNGYIVFAEISGESFFNYKIYSIDKKDFIYEEELKNYIASENFAYVVNFYNETEQRYLHFDCVTGNMYDVTDSYNNFRKEHPELDSVNAVDYQYLTNDTYYTFMNNDGWTLFAGEIRIDGIKYADLVKQNLYTFDTENNNLVVTEYSYQ